MENKAFYHDDIYRDSRGNYCTAMYLHNEHLEKYGTYAKVANPYEECQGKTVRCCYSQIFYPDSQRILCNNIPEADPCFWDGLESGELEDEDENPVEIFQYFIIDAGTAQRLKEHTDAIIVYSQLLDLYVLCVTHFGTGWDYVPEDFVY